MAGHDGQDPDRVAIMARRQRFIALALGGLATGCGPGQPAAEPRDETATGVESSEPGPDGDSGSGSDTESEPEPGPDGESDTESDTEPDTDSEMPMPGLKFDVPVPDPDPGGGGTTGGPLPCLGVLPR